jgi:hypothetical protein
MLALEIMIGDRAFPIERLSGIVEEATRFSTELQNINTVCQV